MNILVTVNEHYIIPLAVMLHSLARAQPEGKISVYLAYSALPGGIRLLESLLPPGRFQLIPVNAGGLVPEEAPVSYRFPQEIYFRFLAPLFLPQDLDRILYLDPDTVILKSLEGFYSQDMGDCFVSCSAHIREPLRKFSELRQGIPEDGLYQNPGVMLLNLPLLRREQKGEDAQAYLRVNGAHLPLPDPDLIHALYGNRILESNFMLYNLSDRMYTLHHAGLWGTPGINLDWVRENTAIIHYSGRNKPWRPDYRGCLGEFYRAFRSLLPENPGADGEEKPKRLLMLVNPYSGRGEIRGKLVDVIDTFIKGGYEVTVHTTQHQDEIPQVIAQRAKQYDLLVACGGDGTLNESVSGLIRSGSGTSLGYIPAGTVNDFAHSLGIPTQIAAAARAIVSGHRFLCDVGSFDGRCFTYIAAFGAFTDVAYQTPQDFKNLLGRMAYVLNGITRLPFLKTYRIRITSGERVVEDDFIFGMVSNSHSIGGIRLNGNKRIFLDDGLMEVLLIRQPRNVLDLQSILTALVQQQFNSECFYAFRTRGLHFSAAEEVPWTLDGENGGSLREGDIQVLGKALPMVVAGPLPTSEKAPSLK